MIQFGQAKEEAGAESMFIDYQMSIDIIKALLGQGGFCYFRKEWADDTTCKEIFRVIELLRRNGTTETFQNSQDAKLCD